MFAYDHLPMHWVGDWLGPWAIRSPTRPAIHDVDHGLTLSYAGLSARVDRVAAWLQQWLGPEQGQVLALLSRNRLEAIEVGLACARLGLRLAPVSHRLPAADIARLLARLQPARVICENRFQSLVNDGAWSSGLTLWHDENDAHAGLPVPSSRPQTRPAKPLSDAWLFIHTGGSTGLPKLCRVTYRQMLWNAFELMVVRGGTRSARDLLTFPLYHIGGWNSVVPILHGGGFLAVTRGFQPEQVLDTLVDQRINHFGGVEAMFRALQASPRFDRTRLAGVEAVTNAGGPCDPGVMEGFLALGVPMVQAYGMTEAGPSNFINSASDKPLEQLQREAESIGTAMPYTDYRIVDPETHAPVESGETGVLCLRSPHAFDGYLDDADRTLACIDAGGWVWTGDLAVEPEPGQVRLCGRIDNVFVSGGENVSPESVERVLLRCPGVRAVVVFAVPDLIWGQRAVAAVVGESEQSPDEASLRAYCAGALAPEQRPVAFHRISAVPLTGAGKPDRQRVRDEYEQQTAASSTMTGSGTEEQQP